MSVKEYSLAIDEKQKEVGAYCPNLKLLINRQRVKGDQMTKSENRLQVKGKLTISF